MDAFPPELLRYLIPFLPLTSLIAARGVNSIWRTLAETASLFPPRKALLGLYLAAVAHPKFPQIVQVLQPHVREFDREAYIADLTSCGCILPDLFELWILEWPSKAVHFWAWPGLQKDLTVHLQNYCEWGNLLSVTPPKIDTIPMPKKHAESVGMMCRGLGLWATRLHVGGGVLRLWLTVDAKETIRCGQGGGLVWTHSYYADEVEGDGPERDMRIFRNTPFVADTLIEFLNLLDLTRGDVVRALQGYYFRGIQWHE